MCLQALLDLQMNSDLKAQLHDLTFTGAKVICSFITQHPRVRTLKTKHDTVCRNVMMLNLEIGYSYNNDTDSTVDETAFITVGRITDRV